MGDPRKQQSKYEKPFRPWDDQRMKNEERLMNEYGLRRKKEIWKAQSLLRQIRRQARELAAEEDEEKSNQLRNKVRNMGLTGEDPSLDDILELELEDLLKRRLQSLLDSKGLANTPKQARQFVVHGHVKVNGRRMKYPSFLVPKDLESEIEIDEKVLDNE
ncbi:MAG: 30S ribosomal protein S4 [Candidatus Aenigmatarchaeota archaeon]